MKVLTLIGTRPELIRLCLIIPKLDEVCEQILVHTGQNYDHNLNDIFMEQLHIREPDYKLGATGTFAEQLATTMVMLERVIEKEKPDAFLVLGDTNSSLGAIMAKRHGVKVFHMEAGNRCYDDKVPEEVNRRIIDHTSDVLLPYTERSRQNLLAEGIPGQRIYVTGNPIREVIDHFTNDIAQSETRDYPYYLVTLHRAENVDNPKRLTKFVEAINKLDLPVVWSVHPRTRKQLKGHKVAKHVELVEPLGFFEFVSLQKSAYCVLTDSGTVQEECAILDVPVVTLRDSTERPETIEAGSNFIAGCELERIKLGIKLAVQNRTHLVPEEYMVKNVSDVIIKIVLEYWVCGQENQ